MPTIKKFRTKTLLIIEIHYPQNSDWPRNVLCHNADGSVTYIGSALTDKKNPELTGGSHFATVDDDDSDYDSENGKNKVSGLLIRSSL